jgi:hypothetical protein|tara:strand:+ start:2781 stop:2990 length:210 start_codon:yes stop_codon:yes gene_type:complete
MHHYKENIIAATEQYLVGHIAKHKMNIDIMLSNHIAVAEHPGMLETIESELAKLAEYDDKLTTLQKYFK